MPVKQPINPIASGRGVTAVLGPTNTGKTHLAIERMAAHSTGLIGLPLRLLAREVYNRLCEKVGAGNVALVTGEERVNTEKARFQVCTVEAMPAETNAAFVAIDEVQIASDMERGHIFTDRLMNLRGREETMLLGAATVEPILRKLLPGIHVISRPRMSMLDYAGSKKITRQPPRSAIVAFSANEVYAIAELIRRQRGGAAVVLGSLSPRTRNAQVALYQSGDVDFLVATDAIGMGLNLDLDHVAFAQDRKFDGFSHRRLTPAEMGQIAGRAGRHTRNGTFGVTGQVQPFEDELVERLITHEFEPAKVLSWRNRDLEFSTLEDLRASLEVPSANRMLIKALPASDIVALDFLARDPWIQDTAHKGDELRLLWDICCIPDYRKISPGDHAHLLQTIFEQIIRRGRIDTDWFDRQIRLADNVAGDIDDLSARIARIRTWTYLSHRAEWLENSTHWQEKTRATEDRLSDALHEALTKRFIDRRTSVLMKKLRENAYMEAEIKPNGDVMVEGHLVGQLNGFRFKPDTTGESPEAKAANAAAARILASEIEKRAGRLAASANTDFILSRDAVIRWQGDPVAKLAAGEEMLKPRVILLADEQLTGPARDSVANRLDRWIANHVANILKPLAEMGGDQTLEGMARGIAFRLIEASGSIDRREIASDVQGLDQDMRAGLRRHGVRFGAYTIFIPALLKPAPAELLCLLWGLRNDKLEAPGMDEIPLILASGRTSTAYNSEFETDIYRLCGYKPLGQKAVRIDILERLADLIRPALYWKGDNAGSAPKPEGAIDGRGFYVTPAMMSILGATHEDMELILKGLGYRGEPRPESEIKPQQATETAAPEAAKAGVPAAETVAAGPTPEVVNPEAASPDSAGIDSGGSTAAPERAAETTAGTDAGTTDETSQDAQPVASGVSPEATAEAPAMDAMAEGGAPAEAPTEATGEEGPRTILVWRPVGKQNRQPGKRPDNARGSHTHTRDQGKQVEQGARAEQSDSGSRGEHADRGGDARPGGRRHKRGPGTGPHSKGAYGKGPHGKGPHGKGPRKPDKSDRGDQQREISSRPPQREKEIDPDSPFAKLAALKAEMKADTKKR